MVPTAARRPPLELSDDRRMALRVRRLGYVSAVALGLIWWLATASLDAPIWVSWSLLAGWLLMPLTLFTSLSRPRVRYGLVVPASLVSVGLLGVLGWGLPTDVPAAAGWVMVTAGVLLGGVLGLWFWFRLAPVPAFLDDPYAPGRWALIGVHVALIVVGWGLAALPLLASLLT